MSQNVERWLLVQWTDGGVDVVHIRSLTNTRHEDLTPGASLTAFSKGESKTGTFICKSHDRSLLEQMRLKIKADSADGASVATEQEQEPEDFSASASSWEPSDEHASESDEVEQKKVKLDNVKQETKEKPKKVLTPSHRANAIIPLSMQSGKVFKKPAPRKRPYENTKKTNEATHKSLPDSTKKNVARESVQHNGQVNVNNVIKIRHCLRDLFGIIKDIDTVSVAPVPTPVPADTPDKPDPTNTTTNVPENENENNNKENEASNSQESDRSGDPVLISNKYQKFNENNSNNTSNKESPKTSKTPVVPQGEWIGIGSGKTLIHKDKFRKINWKSYTMATRTLLLALFPRRVLATHSLTGKRSPAFQNKPAKMCLDPKIISDVIIEVQDRFHVKENLIRSIITTKCADECKMYKMRQEKRKADAAKKEVVKNKKEEEEKENQNSEKA